LLFNNFLFNKIDDYPYGVTSGEGVPTVPALSQGLNAGVVTTSPALRMQDRINTSSAMGGLLPRASIYESGKRDVKGGHGYLQLDYAFSLAPVSALLCVWEASGSPTEH
jgi:hypothetical protein